MKPLAGRVALGGGEPLGGGTTEVGFRTRRWPGGKVKLLRGKRPMEMGAWPLRGRRAPASWSHADEEVGLVCGAPLRPL